MLVSFEQLFRKRVPRSLFLTIRMHSDAQFAGSSSVPAHVEMMGFLGMGNNPMVGATVAIAVAIDLAINKK